MSSILETIKAIVESGEFNKLVGRIEGDSLECKGQPYNFSTEAGKRELAKDISSFANLRGGLIIIGAKTKKSQVHFSDEIEEIRPFDQKLIDPEQYQKLLREWIYPEIENLSIRYHKEASSAKGVFVIDIPEQKQSLKPFLIKKWLDGQKTVEILFGYAERRRDNSQPLSVIDIHTALQRGLHYDQNIQRGFADLQAQLGELVGRTQKQEFAKRTKSLLDDRINTIFANSTLKDRRSFVLVAQPGSPTEVQKLFESSPGGIRALLENPPVLRYAGWDLHTLGPSQIIKGEFVRTVSGDRKILELYKDGTLIFAGLADVDFLAWGSDNSDKPKLNPAALVEVIYSFMAFYEEVLKHVDRQPETLTFQMRFYNMKKDGIPSYLFPYQLGSYGQATGERHDAPENEAVLHIQISTKDFSPEKTAYELVEEVYLWFGMEPEKIPYITPDAKDKKIDIEKIRKL
ncbi:MAG TPA: ATP-binding protein [Candidatus Angelobacter sp.]